MRSAAHSLSCTASPGATSDQGVLKLTKVDESNFMRKTCDKQTSSKAKASGSSPALVECLDACVKLCLVCFARNRIDALRQQGGTMDSKTGKVTLD